MEFFLSVCNTKCERGSATAFVTIILNVLASDFNVSTSRLTRVAAWDGQVLYPAVLLAS